MSEGPGFPALIARIADGTVLDARFDQNWSGMKSAGVVRGAYQFFEPGEEATAQANAVIQKLGTLGAGDLPVSLDCENTGGQSSATSLAGLTTWADRIAQGTGKRPILSTNRGFWNASVGSSAFGNLPLWIAAYGTACPDTPTGWSDWRAEAVRAGPPPARGEGAALVLGMMLARLRRRA